jgi:hypothetical protein
MYEELIKRLRNRRVCIQSGGNLDTDFPLMSEAADAIEELQRQIDGWIEQERKALLKSMPKWIPVTERLPNIEDDVLIYGEWTGASGTKYREVLLTDFKEFLHQGYKPIAWMPPPEPPKEETE